MSFAPSSSSPPQQTTFLVRKASDNGKLNALAEEFKPRSRSENSQGPASTPVTGGAQSQSNRPAPHPRAHDSDDAPKSASGRGGLSSELQAQSSGQRPKNTSRGGERRAGDGGPAGRPRHNSGRKAERLRGDSGGQSPLSRSPANANHLLGFRYEERARAQSHSGRTPGSGGRGGRRAAAFRPKPYRKEHFLQANFRFVVSDGVDVARYMEHADRMFDWEDVLQVEVSTPTQIQCPISLEAPPVVPVLTSCGHIFSLHSIVHHMLQGGGEKFCRASSCPLCYNTVAARDLRLVTIRRIEAIDLGKPVSFSLIRRPVNSILPQSEDKHVIKQSYSPTDPLASERFAKFVTAADSLPLFRSTATTLAHFAADVLAAGGLEAEIEGPCLFKSMDVLVMLARNWAVRRAELLASNGHGNVVGADTEGDAGAAEADAIEAAMRDVFMVELADENVRSDAARARAKQDEERDAAFPSLGGGGPPATPAQRPPFSAWRAGGSDGAVALTPPSDVSGAAGNDGVLDMSFEMGFGEEGDDGRDAVESHFEASLRVSSRRAAAGDSDDGFELLGSSPSQALSVNQVEDGHYHFLYQSSDGQWLFMHPINVRCLLNHYKRFSSCPASVVAKVIEVEDMTQTETVRRKLQALSHLPLTAEFKLCEVDLTHMLPEAALAPFKAELQQRMKLRAKRAALARRSAARDAAAAAERMFPKGPTMEDLGRMPLPHEIGLTEEELAESIALQTSVDEAGGVSAAARAGPSYATLTRMGLAATGPSLGGAGEGAVAPSPAPRGAWGAGAGHAASPASAARTWGAGAAASPPSDELAEAPVVRQNKKGQKVLFLTLGGR